MKKKNNILIELVKKNLPWYFLGLSTLLMVDYVNLLIPEYTGKIVDGLSSRLFNLEQITKVLIAILISSFLIMAGRMLWRMFIFGTSRKIEREIRNSLFAKLETLSSRYFNYHKTGDLMAHFTNDLEALRNSLGPAIVSSFDAVVMTLLTLYKMMIGVDFKLTLMALVPMSIIGVGGYYFGEYIEKKFTDKQEAFASLSDYVQESITGERVIKAFCQENKQARAFAKVNRHSFNKNMSVVKTMATVFPLLELVIGITYIIALIYGGYLTMINQITLGQFIAFNQYISMLIWPMIALGDALTSFSQGRAAMGRILAVFKEENEIKESENAINHKIQGEIEFKNVSFSYDQNEVISDLNLKIHQGETLAIVGRLGSGKTTLMSLLFRLYDPTQGQILIDGHDLKDLNIETYRKSLSYVPQDSFLFSDTLENNLLFGVENKTEKDMIEACENACIHDNIIQFPNGYQTMVGERGVTLSGGQKQRTSIARALIKDSALLILDDSLSAVDTDTEEKILGNLKHIRDNKTTIIIAHRISTIMNADHILVLEEGKLKEYGTFDELMQLNGIFKEMYDKQQLEKQLSQGGEQNG